MRAGLLRDKSVPGVGKLDSPAVEPRLPVHGTAVLGQVRDQAGRRGIGRGNAVQFEQIPAVPPRLRRLDQPLAPDTDYVWTLRARFRLGEAERTTRWSGDWFGARAKGFVFYTPR